MKFSERVRDLMLACLIDEYGDESDPDAVFVEGLTSKFVFSREKLEAHRDEYIQLAQGYLSDGFKKTGGGGCSFLALPFDKNDEQQCEQPTAQEFLVLGIGLGLAEYCMPRELWMIFPGGMPYVAFDIQ